jgi:hypothetical protein
MGTNLQCGMRTNTSESCWGAGEAPQIFAGDFPLLQLSFTACGACIGLRR